MYKDEELEAMKSLSQKIGKGLKIQEDLARFTQALTMVSVEAALNAELDHHLGYEKAHLRSAPIAAMATPTKPSRPKMAHLVIPIFIGRQKQNI